MNMNDNVKSTISKERLASFKDAAYLRLYASNLSYNNETLEAATKHRLLEIAMRIETGYYNEY